VRARSEGGLGDAEGGRVVSSRRLTIWQRSFRSFSGRYSHCRTFAIQPSRSAPCTFKKHATDQGDCQGAGKLSPLQCAHTSLEEQQGEETRRSGTENRILVMILLPSMPRREEITGAGSGATE
jgi:hypothetical protein